MSDIIKLIENCIRETPSKKTKREDLYNLGVAILTDAGYNKPVDYLKRIIEDDKE